MPDCLERYYIKCASWRTCKHHKNVMTCNIEDVGLSITWNTELIVEFADIPTVPVSRTKLLGAVVVEQVANLLQFDS